MRRSFDDGESWEPPRVVLPDFFNATEQVGTWALNPLTVILTLYCTYVT